MHGSEARGYKPGMAADPAVELANLRRGYQELLTRVNEIDRGHSQRLDECPELT